MTYGLLLVSPPPDGIGKNDPFELVGVVEVPLVVVGVAPEEVEIVPPGKVPEVVPEEVDVVPPVVVPEVVVPPVDELFGAVTL